MLQKIYRKIVNYETMSYLICGVLTTVVDWVVFWVLYERCQMDHKISTAVSFMAAVLFAYVVNKLIVFRNFQFKPAYLWVVMIGISASVSSLPSVRLNAWNPLPSWA